VDEKLTLSEGEDLDNLDTCFDACSVREKAFRLGFVVTPKDYAADNDTATRFVGILHAHRLHLEKYVEPSVFANLLKTTPHHSAGEKHATHQRRLDIFMAWQCPCKEVCECGRFHCMVVGGDATPLVSKGISNEVVADLPALEGKDTPSDDRCHTLFAGGMFNPFNEVQRRLSQESLSTGTRALNKGMGGGDMKTGDTIPPVASTICTKDDPFAPREGKKLVWTGVSMTLVCSNVCFFGYSAIPLASIPHNASYFF
jgi:hypothetical protein